jgi:hypothetical protein
MGPEADQDAKRCEEADRILDNFPVVHIFTAGISAAIRGRRSVVARPVRGALRVPKPHFLFSSRNGITPMILILDQFRDRFT